MRTGLVEQLTIEQKYEYLRLHGAQPSSYLTTQPGFTEFHIPGMGYASFARHLGANLVLGDPICDPADRPHFLTAMLEAVPKPTFVQVSRDCALLLGERFGYKINSFGIETDIPLKDFTLSGNKKNNLRYAVRHGKEVARVIESDMAGLARDHGIGRADIERVFASWMGTRKARHQLRFLIRPPVFDDEPGVRKFYAIDADNRLLGYVFFSPMHRGGQLIGYYNDINVAAEDAPSGLATYITLMAIEQFRQGGVGCINLGMSPLAQLDQIEDMPADSARVRLTLKIFFETGNHFYNFKGAHAHKQRYHGHEYPVFLATSWPLKIVEITLMSHYVGLLHFKNMPGIKQIYDIWRRAEAQA